MNSPPILLCIETSNEICSVAIARGADIISMLESSEKNSHAQNINIFIQDVLAKAIISSKEINAVVVSSGPGSYTGLRIGVSSAKGFCFANNIPLIAINTLDAMLNSMKKNTFRVALIHARQHEFYCSSINSIEEKINDNEIIFSEKNNFPFDEKVLISTNNLKAVKEQFFSPNYIFIEHFSLSAKHLAVPALEKFQNNRFEDVAYFEPNYIKPAHINKNSI